MIAGLLPLHGDGAYRDGLLHSTWHVEPTVVLGVLGMIAAYVVWTGPLNRRRPGAAERVTTPGQRRAFLGGAVALFVALAPPLDDWADRYLLSAHMVQHLLLMLLVAPLLLIGTPAWMLRPLLRNRIVAKAGYLLTRPIAALVVSSGVMILWHMPGLYVAALESEPMHAAQHLSFLAAAVLAWWPLLSPVPAWPRLAPLLQCLYLFVLTIPGGIVGAFITLAEPGLYGPYENAPRLWGIGLDTDQQIAGLMMWVFENVIFFILITIIFFRWAGREERAERAAAGPLPAAPHR